jgi:hypothetical protein
LSEEPQPSINVTFGHGHRHLAGTLLAPAQVEAENSHDISVHMPPPGTLARRRIEVGGAMVEYRAFRIDERRVHVGTYYPI